MSDEPPVSSRGSRRRTRTDLGIAVAVGTIASALYWLTRQPEWQFDTLRFADHLQRGQVQDLLRFQHSLGNLIAYVARSAARVVGWDVPALETLGLLNVVAAGFGLAVVYLTSRRLGAARVAALFATGLAGATMAAWRAGAQMTIYGTALASIAIAWYLLVRYVHDRRPAAAFAAGGAVGIALSAHLAAAALVVPAVVLVVGQVRRDVRDRIADLLRIAGATALAAAAVLVPSAMLASSASFGQAVRWFTVSASTVAGRAQGRFGLGSVVHALAGGPYETPGARRAFVLVAAVGGVILIAFAAAGLIAGIRGTTSLPAVASAAHVGAAIVAALWYFPDPDYVGLAMVPLALLWGIGIESASRYRVSARVLAVPAALAVGGLLTWNFVSGVSASLERSDMRRRAAAAILRATGPDDHVLLSAFVAPRVAYEGRRAETGWSAILRGLNTGAPRPVLPSVVRDGGPIFVSSRALELDPDQAARAGTDTAGLWEALETCCDVLPIATFRTDGGTETLFEVRAVDRG